MNRLPIYYEGQEVAGLILNQHGFLELEYTKAWQLHGFDISVSLPRFHLKHTGYEVRAFFENMLPEGRIRESLARQYGTNPENIFGILKHVGQDCAGAFSIGGPGTQGHYAALSTGQIQELLNKLPEFPMASGERQTSLSLAGAQHKLPLFHHAGEYYLPQQGAASNCILKLPIDGFPHSVENEHLCLELARSIGLPTVRSHILPLPEYPVLVVNRYDREGTDFHPRRLPQEDFCQMMALSSDIKYERDGGPSFYDCSVLIRRYSLQPAVDLSLLIKWAAFNLCIGNNDAHAKNISMIRQGNGRCLAPFYDLLSTTYYGRRLARRMAMGIGGKRNSFFISGGRWERFAQDINVPAKAVIQQVKMTAQSLLSALNKIPQLPHIPESTMYHFTQHIRQRTQSVLEHLNFRSRP